MSWSDEDITPTYEFYTTQYHGKMGEDAFMASLPDAVAEVGYALLPNANLDACADRAKMAACAVCDLVGNPDVKRTSYSAGNVSESYAAGADAGFALTSEASIRRWLAGRNVLKNGAWL